MVTDRKSELVGFPGGLAVQRERPDAGGSPSLDFLRHPGMGDDESPTSST